MSLEALLEEIRARGDTEIFDIESHSQTRVNQILEEARAEADKIRREVCEEIASPAREERARVVNEARLRALRILDEARQFTIDETLEQARQQLAGVREDENYGEILESLVKETLSDFENAGKEDQKVRLQADDRDRDLVEKVIKNSDQEIAVTYDLETWGGVVARSRDGRIEVNNMLESRLSRAEDYLRRYLAAKLS